MHEVNRGVAPVETSKSLTMQIRNLSLGADEELARLACGFTAEPETVRLTLRAWLNDDPSGFTLSAVRYLAQNPSSPAGTCVCLLLGRNEQYFFHLTDPERLMRQQAIAAARILSREDKRFFVKLTHFANDTLSVDRVTRVMQIVEALGAAGLMVPWLRRMTRHDDPYVRQKAVMIMCQAGSNPMLVEKQLQSTDARVRANAVQSLWTVTAPAARALLEYATKDAHHRVALNALVGLFLQGDPTALARMIAHARNGSPPFRIAAAWALGQSRKAEAWHALDTLSKDPIAHVRESAVRALVNVPQPMDNPSTPQFAPAPGAAPEQAPHSLRTPTFRTIR